MAMEKKTVADVTPVLRNGFQRAQEVLGRNSVDYAVELLKEIVKKEPGFLDARNLLRTAEVRKAGGMGAVQKVIRQIKALKYVISAKTSLSKKPDKALADAEEALAMYVYNGMALGVLKEAGIALQANFIVIEALELMLQMDDKNEANMRELAEIAEAEGEGGKVLRVRQLIAAKHPGDLEAQAALRAAAALASMAGGKIGVNKNRKDVKKGRKSKGDSEEVALEDLLRDDRPVRDEEDMKRLVEYYEKKIAAGEDTIDDRRRLSEFYQRLGRFTDAIASFEWIVQKLGTLDPSIDKSIEACRVANAGQQVEKLKSENAPQEEIDKVVAEINSYRLERAEDRVKTYPNDTMMRYELGCIYWEFNEVEKALQQFQIGQRNPNKRLNAIVYIGRCFARKHQYDMAVEQFEKAVAEMPTMDALKMEALYHMGCTYDAINRKKEAIDCYKQIYAVNINYEDVSARLDAYYAAQEKARQAEQQG